MSTRTGKEATELSGKRPAGRTLDELAEQALDVAVKARKHRKSLSGVHPYAAKFARLRADATLALRELGRSGRDSSQLAPLLETIFAPKSEPKARLAARRELAHQLTTEWGDSTPAALPGEDDAIFPTELLKLTRRKYLHAIAWQANGCFVRGWFDACAVMMRRLLETSIIEAFEAKGVAQNAKTGGGDYFQLTQLIDAAVAEPAFSLTRNTKGALPRLRDVGHTSAHSRHYTAVSSDIERVRHDFRVAVQEFLSLAALL